MSFRTMNLEQISVYLEQAATLSSEEELSLELDRRCGARHLLYRYRKRRLLLQQELARLQCARHGRSLTGESPEHAR